jgi:hypothetical protein
MGAVAVVVVELVVLAAAAAAAAAMAALNGAANDLVDAAMKVFVADVEVTVASVAVLLVFVVASQVRLGWPFADPETGVHGLVKPTDGVTDSRVDELMMMMMMKMRKVAMILLKMKMEKSQKGVQGFVAVSPGGNPGLLIYSEPE